MDRKTWDREKGILQENERLVQVANSSGEDRAMRDGWRAEELQREAQAFAQPVEPGDTGIRDAVARRLAYDVCVDEGDIVLTVRDGVVGLDGLVNDGLAKQRAGEIAAAVDGVRGVRNDLTVRNISAAVPVPGTMAAMEGEGEGERGMPRSFPP